MKPIGQPEFRLSKKYIEKASKNITNKEISYWYLENNGYKINEKMKPHSLSIDSSTYLGSETDIEQGSILTDENVTEELCSTPGEK